MTSKRNLKISIRVNEEEKQDLLDRCDKANLANWMRGICLGQEVKKEKVFPLADPKLITELSRIGNNINQIAREVNSKSFNEIDKVQIISYLQSIDQEMRIIRESHK